MHAKYEVSISYGSKVIAKVKVDNRQINKQTNKQTGQKPYVPDHSIQGHKNKMRIGEMLNNLIIGEDIFFVIYSHGQSMFSTEGRMSLNGAEDIVKK